MLNRLHESAVGKNVTLVSVPNFVLLLPTLFLVIVVISLENRRRLSISVLSRFS